MVDWKELHIQSNLPLIVLAISFVCVVIIGFLEFKKISMKIEQLSSQIDSIKKGGNNEVKDKRQEGKAINDKKEEGKVINDKKEEGKVINDRTEEVKGVNDRKEEGKDVIDRKEEEKGGEEIMEETNEKRKV